MNSNIVVKSFEDLGRFTELFGGQDSESDGSAREPAAAMPSGEELTHLADTVSGLLVEIQALMEQDGRSRERAEEALEQYRRLQRMRIQLAQLSSDARSIAESASTMADLGFDPNCRQRAKQLSQMAAHLGDIARFRLASVASSVEELGQQEEVARLLAEEREREETERREAEEKEREARLDQSIRGVERLVSEQKIDEALRTLGALDKLYPNDPTVASYLTKVRRQAWIVKACRAEDTLKAARKLLRRAPREAAALLEPLDLTDTPVELARQVYGCWLHACRRLNLAQPLHYSPAFNRGAVLVTIPNGQLEVVSAIGLPNWTTGKRFSASAVRSARPLR